MEIVIIIAIIITKVISMIIMIIMIITSMIIVKIVITKKLKNHQIKLIHVTDKSNRYFRYKIKKYLVIFL